jgi:ribosomal protein S18 acetylase RimI-like enzyme
VTAPVVRPVAASDAPDLAALLNAIIARGGTTAHETPLSPDVLAQTYLVGPAVICCHVAVDGDGAALGFQTLVKGDRVSADWGDIATFAKVDGTQRGVGTALFAATRAAAAQHGLAGISATIRGDNGGGLKFYTRLGFEDHAVAPAVPLNDGTPVDRITKRFVLA